MIFIGKGNCDKHWNEREECIIEPSIRQINPNNIMSLFCELTVYDHQELDISDPIRHQTIISPKSGYVFLTLTNIWARPNEYTDTRWRLLIPILEGRSSRRPPGRLLHPRRSWLPATSVFASCWTLGNLLSAYPHLLSNVKSTARSYHDIDSEYDTYQHGNAKHTVSSPALWKEL